MTDWTHFLFSGSIHTLGFAGLFGITLLPLRAFLIIRGNAFLWRSTFTGKAAITLVLAAAILAIWNSVQLAAKVFRCLTDMHCGPNQSSGWISLAFIGAFYLGFEIFSNVVLLVARRAVREAN